VTSTNRYAISVYKAAAMLLERGYEGKEVENILNVMPQPTCGYVYADNLPRANKNNTITTGGLQPA